MNKKNLIFAIICLIIFMLILLPVSGLIGNQNAKYYIIISSIAAAIVFVIPLYKKIYNWDNDRIAYSDDIFLIFRGFGAVIITISTYNFIFSDYATYKRYEITYVILFLILILFFIFNRAIDLITNLKRKKEESDSNFKFVVNCIFLIIDLALLILPIYKMYSPKIEINLPALKTPTALEIDKINPNNIMDWHIAEISDKTAILHLCDSIPKTKVENLRNLDSLQYDKNKQFEQYYYVIKPEDFKEYNSDGSIKNGYFYSIEILQDGEAIISGNEKPHKETFIDSLIQNGNDSVYRVYLSKDILNYVKSLDYK